MFDYEIRKLSLKFYNDYPNNLYHEILLKKERSYDVVLFEIEILSGYFVCVLFRSEMNHKNGYLFRFSNRSKNHKSGLDFSKLVIINNSGYIGNQAIIDKDEYIELKKKEYIIHNRLEKYIIKYINHQKQKKILNQKEFDRLYKYSTLKYFHKELGLE